MPRKAEARTPKAKTATGFRLEPELLKRIDAVAKALSEPGREMTRTDAARMALFAGLPLVEERAGIAKAKRR